MPGRFLAFAAMGVVLTSCMSCNVPPDAAALQQFTIGSTTAAEVHATLGVPDTETSADGIRTLTYRYEYDRGRWENFIPVAGGFAGGFDKMVQVDIFVFTGDGRLKSYEQTGSENGVETPKTANTAPPA